jgi:RNA polymerase sigma-70 factor (ECF subfamily)
MSVPSFEEIVDALYGPLYRFALSLTRREADAWDLTQQAFYKWARASHQIRDPMKAKSWLFTTLHRDFLSVVRRHSRFPHCDLETSAADLPAPPSENLENLDGATVLEKLMEVDEIYRVPLSLFYLDELTYVQIGEILDLPIGTVMSRLSRGKEQLRRKLSDTASTLERKVVRFAANASRGKSHHG